jgi:hypothetical protein
MMDTESLIDSLADDLTPVRPVKPRNGIALALAAAFVAALGVIAVFGARSDIIAGTPDPIVLVRGMLLVLLGLATSFAVNNAARPSVGNGHNGWVWALAAAMVVPVAALVLFVYHRVAAMPFAPGDLDFQFAPWCLGISMTSALLIGAVQTLWLRRGAPTDVNRAGWLVGLAAGGFGTFAYSLHCPSNSIYYVGLFYGLAVAICAALGRLIVPRLIKW